MSDMETQPQAETAVAPAPAAAPSAGALLRAAREAQGLHIAALAVSLKVSVKKLEALEADKLDALHDAVFVRALASSVCRALKIDPAAVLEKLPQGRVPALEADDRGINAPFHASGEVSAGVSFAALRSPVFITVVLLLLAAVALALVPDISTLNLSKWMPHSSPVPAKTASELPVAAAPDVVAAPPVVPPASAVVSKPSQPVAEPPAATASAALVPALTTAPAAAASAATATASQAVGETGASQVLVFKSRGTSWVQVSDAKGAVLFSKNMHAADVGEVRGLAPLSVVIGRADAIALEVNAKPFDLAAHTRENVARFEVK